MVLQDEEVDYVFYQDVRAYSNPQLYPAELVKRRNCVYRGQELLLCGFSLSNTGQPPGTGCKHILQHQGDHPRHQDCDSQLADE